MSNEMVERVARAMSVKDKGDDHWDVMSEDGDGFGYVGKNEYRAMARAAITAMREPTDAMVEAGADEDYRQEEHGLHVDGHDPRTLIWQAMIGAALTG